MGMKLIIISQLFFTLVFASFFSPYHDQGNLCLLHLLEAREHHVAPDLVQSESIGPLFPKKDHWLGADAAYTVLLPNGKTIWLFGDTFLGSVDDGRGFERFIDNSIGVTKGPPPFKNPKYIWDHSVVPHGDSYFKSSKPNHKLWPKAGFYLNGSLYVFLVEVRVLSKEEVSANEASLGFEEVGISLGRIENILESPSQWKPKVFDLTGSMRVFLGTSVLVIDGFIYSYSTVKETVKEAQGQSMVLHRISVDDFLSAELAGFQELAVEYYSRDKGWLLGLDSPSLKKLVDRGATELSVHWDVHVNKWLMIQSEPMTHDVWVRWSDEIEGPWSQPHTIFQYPETLVNSSIFAYAAKAHPQYSDGSLFFTYVTNLLDEKGLELILSDLGTYTPIGVKLDYEGLRELIQKEESKRKPYRSYSQLQKENVRDVHYRIEASKKKSPYLSLAIHGGKIEFGTSEIAREVAGDEHSYYLFEGIKTVNNSALHITSVDFDEPQAIEMASSSSICISFHGYKDDRNSRVCLGGQNQELSRIIYEDFVSRGLVGGARRNEALLNQSSMNPCNRYHAIDPQNIVNRCESAGVQIEMSSRLRRHLLKSKEARRVFVSSIRASLERYQGR